MSSKHQDQGERWAERHAMVESQLRARGIRDERVLAAMLEVPRHAFVPSGVTYAAYEDRALAIGEGQTISQPYMVARACELAELQPGQRALEIGAGSGYQAAILSRLCDRVVAVELIDTLAERARAQLSAQAIENVRVVTGDGTRGFAEEAPYDAVLVAAGAPDVPEALVEQVAPGGRIVIPLGSGSLQTLTVVRRGQNGGVSREEHDACVYVPLRGAGGWTEGGFDA
jgi:protein-L-isoaspartate(D-aspartate) O-methyltransferase